MEPNREFPFARKVKALSNCCCWNSVTWLHDIVKKRAWMQAIHHPAKAWGNGVVTGAAVVVAFEAVGRLNRQQTRGGRKCRILQFINNTK